MLPSLAGIGTAAGGHTGLAGADEMNTERKIGYQAIIKVNGFNDARNWIRRLIREGIVKCGQCDKAATHVFWQDQAEWYCRCDDHPEIGDQWTGSTRWNPTSFGINVIREAANTFLETLEPSEAKRIRIRPYDATDYYALMDD